MGEVATCRECWGQEWIVHAGSLECCKCHKHYSLHHDLPSTEIVDRVNDPNYGVLKVFETEGLK